jgi:hypothetical protein
MFCSVPDTAIYVAYTLSNIIISSNMYVQRKGQSPGQLKRNYLYQGYTRCIFTPREE